MNGLLPAMGAGAPLPAFSAPHHAPYAPALAYHPYHGVSYTHRSPQGLGKREAEAEPLNIGYRGRYSGRFYGVRLGKREAQPYGYIGVRGGFRGRSFGFGRRFGKREA